MMRGINIGNKKVIIKHMERLISEVNKLECFIEIVEKKKIKGILEEFKENCGGHSSFREFISNQEEKGAILTKAILKGVYEGVGMKANVNGFVRDFRRIRPNKLNFVSKKDIKDLGDFIKKKIKIDMKDLKLMRE